MEIFTYKYDDLINPCLESMHKLGGSGKNNEIQEQVTEILDLSEDQVGEIHRHNQTKLSYRLFWARNYLKQAGLLENSSRGVWTLTPKGQETKVVDKDELKKYVRSLSKNKVGPDDGGSTDPDEDAKDDLKWQVELLDELKKMDPTEFEFFTQRLLSELDFENVEVTGSPGDQGIDGRGRLRVGELLTFRVVFQCKRYKGVVSSNAIRDFRGASEGLADKRLVITTGRFTRDARKEARKEGKKPIDLIDGNELVEILKDLRLGVEVEKVEKVTINKEFFRESQNRDSSDSE